MNNNIVITGEGIICAIGQDKQSVLDSLQHKHSGIGTMQFLRSCHKELPVGEVPLSNDDMRNLLGVTDTLINRTTLMGMLAVRQALEDAALPCHALSPPPCACYSFPARQWQEWTLQRICLTSFPTLTPPCNAFATTVLAPAPV